MAQYKLAREKTAINEGGYTKHPSDNGNWTGGKVGAGRLAGTKNGISAPVLSAFLGHPCTEAEMRAMSADVEFVIYKKNYWDKMRGDEIESQAIAESLYDSCVNFGPAGAIKMLQKSLKVPETGKMDSETLAAVNKK